MQSSGVLIGLERTSDVFEPRALMEQRKRWMEACRHRVDGGVKIMED